MVLPLPEASEVPHLCYVKQFWADAWVQVPLLECTLVSDVAAPSHATASVVHRYGVGMLPAIGNRPADTAFSVVSRSGLAGKYLKVETPGWQWIGIITDRDDDRDGDLGQTFATGMEKYVAYGLTILLDRMSGIRASIVEDVVTGGGAVKRISTAVPFRWTSSAPGQLAFEYRKNNWTARRALEYLLRHFSPSDLEGNVPMQFVLTGDLSGLDYVVTDFEYHGQTLWQILNRLITRQRGLGFNAVVVGNAVELRVWSFSEVAISAGNLTIPANPTQVGFTFDGAVNTQTSVVTDSVINYYDQVEVLGAPRGSVFTIGPDQFEKNWYEIHEDEYTVARSEDADFGDLEDEEKYRRNAIFRSNDKLAKVFSWWWLKRDWDGIDYAGVKYVFPVIDEDGLPDDSQSAEYYVPELRVSETMPIDLSQDLSVAPNIDFRVHNPIPPLVWFGYEQAEHMDAAADGDEEARTWSVQIRTQTDEAGLIFEVSGGQQHYIAQDLFTPTGTFEEIPPEAEAVDSDSWLATIYMQHHQHCRAAWPLEDDVVSGDVARVLTFTMPKARLDWLVPGTIIGTESDGTDGTEYVLAAGGWLRDDRELLQQVARMLWVWFGRIRRVLQLSFRKVYTQPAVGTLITDIGRAGNSEVINTVVTSLSIDLTSGVTTIKTQAAELDVEGLL